MPVDYASDKIDQKLYKPLIEWVLETLNKHDCKGIKGQIIFSLLLSIAVSYCQPEIAEERLSSILHFIGADNLEVLEYKHMINNIKKDLKEKNNANISCIS